MKRLASLLIGLFLCGCVYEVPLVEEAVVLIDPELTGTWQLIPDEGEPEDPTAQLVILPFSQTEYAVICSPAQNDRTVFRAYPAHVNGMELVQLEWLQAEAGQKRYHVCRYTLLEGRLTVQTLNNDLVSDLITDSAALREALIENCRDPKIFSTPMVYRKMNRK